MAGRGPLVDAEPAAPPLLRAGAGRRARRGRLPRTTFSPSLRSGSGRQLVPAEGLMYVELHCHSAFSFLDGASTPLELAAVAAELGYPTLALTDHDGLWGSMEFAQSCKDFGVRPITGAEVTIREQGEHHPPAPG